MPGHVASRDEGAHAVPEQEKRQARETFFQFLPHPMFILDQMVPSVPFPEIPEIVFRQGRPAVAQMVVSADHITLGAELSGQPGIPADMLRHAMADLDHADRLSLRFPQGRIHRRPAVRAHERQFRLSRHL